MTHGNGAVFEVDLPLAGTPGIESRSGGANGSYTMVFRFLDPVSAVGGVTVSNGSAVVAANRIGDDPREYLVSLNGVNNAQSITVTLSNVHDAAGNVSASVSGTMAVLIGDSNADGFVNSADIGQTKSQSGQAVTSSNFREDVNGDGFINSADIGLVKSKSGTALP
jgi:hypothetical protein